MASDDQIRANRENSQYSTGPDDTSGTRYNGLKHGKYYRGGKVLPTENLNEFLAMGEAMYEDLRPVGFTEFRLCMLMNERQWEMDRYSRMKVDVQYSADYRDTMIKELEKLEGLQERAERSFDRAMRRLEKRQNYRRRHYPDLEAQAGTLENKVRYFLANFSGAHWPYQNSQGEIAEVNMQEKAIRYLHQQEVKAKGYSNIWNHYLQWADELVGTWDFDNGDPPPETLPESGNPAPAETESNPPSVAFATGFVSQSNEALPEPQPEVNSNTPREADVEVSDTVSSEPTVDNEPVSEELPETTASVEAASETADQPPAASPKEPDWKQRRNWEPSPRVVHEPTPPKKPSS